MVTAESHTAQSAGNKCPALSGTSVASPPRWECGGRRGRKNVRAGERGERHGILTLTSGYDTAVVLFFFFLEVGVEFGRPYLSLRVTRQLMVGGGGKDIVFSGGVTGRESMLIHVPHKIYWVTKRGAGRRRRREEDMKKQQRPLERRKRIQGNRKETRGQRQCL